MADELTLSVSLTYTPTVANQVKVAPPTFSALVDTGSDHAQGTQVLSTSAEDFAGAAADIGTGGYVLVKNLSTTIDVLMGGSTDFLVKLQPGEFALFRTNLTGTSFKIKSVSGTPTVQYWYFESA